MMKNDSLGDRMKMLEKANTKVLIKGLPVVVRLDGRSFHNFTKGMDKPFDSDFIEIMQDLCKFMVEETNAIIGYVCSDEITLVLHTEDYKSELYFGGKHEKIVSTTSAIASVKFNKMLLWTKHKQREVQMPTFDSRCFNLPSKQEVVNMLIWREKDAVRNSIQSAGQSLFSHKQLHGKSCDEIQDMLMVEKGVNWNNYSSAEKRGSYFKKISKLTKFSAEELKVLPPLHAARKDPSLMIERSVVECVDLPILTTIDNPINVIFGNE